MQASSRQLLDEAGEMPKKTLDLYGGNFLPDDLDESWSVTARERLRGKFIHALSSHGAVLEGDGNPSAAIQCYVRGLDADQIVESFHQGLMRCYERLGRPSEAFSVYRRLRDTLSVILGVPPADETNRLFQDMLERQSAEGLSTPLSDIDGRCRGCNRKVPAVAEHTLARLETDRACLQHHLRASARHRGSLLAANRRALRDTLQDAGKRGEEWRILEGQILSRASQARTFCITLLYVSIASNRPDAAQQRQSSKCVGPLARMPAAPIPFTMPSCAAPGRGGAGHDGNGGQAP